MIIKNEKSKTSFDKEKSGSVIPLYDDSYCDHLMYQNADRLKDIILRGLKAEQNQSSVSPLGGYSYTSDLSTDSLDDVVKQIFNRAKGKVFEDGVESPFSQELIDFIYQYERAGLDAIANLLEKLDENVVSEALRWLGTLDICKPKILTILEEALYSNSDLVRDGAIIGIANFDDPRLVRGLKVAMKREPNSSLKSDMEEVIKQLDRE